MKRKFKIFELKQENYDSIYYQPQALLEPSGDLGSLEFDTKEDAVEELERKANWEPRYTILEILSRE